MMDWKFQHHNKWENNSIFSKDSQAMVKTDKQDDVSKAIRT